MAREAIVFLIVEIEQVATVAGRVWRMTVGATVLRDRAKRSAVGPRILPAMVPRCRRVVVRGGQPAGLTVTAEAKCVIAVFHHKEIRVRAIVRIMARGALYLAIAIQPDTLRQIIRTRHVLAVQCVGRFVQYRYRMPIRNGCRRRASYRPGRLCPAGGITERDSPIMTTQANQRRAVWLASGQCSSRPIVRVIEQVIGLILIPGAQRRRLAARRMAKHTARVFALIR